MNERDKATEHHKSRIPEFASREEEAEFWDTHDFTDYLDELEPIKVHVANPLTGSVLVRFDEETDHELEVRAQEQGVKKSTLVRMVVKEWLRQNRDRRAS